MVHYNPFTFNGMHITDPTLDETGRRSVDPVAYYGQAFLNANPGYQNTQYESDIAKMAASHGSTTTTEITIYETWKDELKGDNKVSSALLNFLNEIETEAERVRSGHYPSMKLSDMTPMKLLKQAMQEARSLNLNNMNNVISALSWYHISNSPSFNRGLSKFLNSISSHVTSTYGENTIERIEKFIRRSQSGRI